MICLYPVLRAIAANLLQGLMGSEDMSKPGSVSADMVPLTRAGTEEDAGGALLFMCSRAGAYTSRSLHPRYCISH